jgi:hypothetical protein
MANSLLSPNGVTTSDVGSSDERFRHLYLSGNVSDGTNAASVSAIVTGAVAGFYGDGHEAKVDKMECDECRVKARRLDFVKTAEGLKQLCKKCKRGND